MCSIVLCLITDQMTVLTDHVLHGALWGLSLVGPGSSGLHSHRMLQQSHKGWATYPHQTVSSQLSCSASLVGHTEAISVPTHKPDGGLSFGLQVEGAMKCSFIELSSSFPHSLPSPQSETPTLHKTKGGLIPSTHGSSMLCATIQIMDYNSPEEW